MRTMKKLTALILTLCMVLTLMAFPAAAAAEYTDMPPVGHWSHDAMQAAVDNGILKGADGALNPQGLLTRAQLAAVVNRCFGATVESKLDGFTDVPAKAWYYADMAKAVRMKTFGGDGGGQLMPEGNITREEAFAVLARALKLPDGEGKALDKFSDQAEVSPWAVGAVSALAAGGYIAGNGDKLSPKDTITRAEFAQVLYHIFGTYFSKAGVYSQIGTGNVMVNAPGVTLKGVKITGDLVLGEGVGDGDVVLDGVTVTGRLVVRGGGEHSIRIINQSNVGSVVLGKTADGGVRILSEKGCQVKTVVVDDGKDDVILEGSFQTVTVENKTAVVLQNAIVNNLEMNAPGSSVAIDGKSSVTTATVAKAAEGTSLTVGKDAQVAKLSAAAPKTSVAGSGKVVEAAVSGDGTKIDTKGTTVTVDKNTTGVTAGNQPVAGGDKVTTKPNPPSGGGSSGGTVTRTETVTTPEQLSAALDPANTAVIAVVVTGNLTLRDHWVQPVGKPLTVSAGAIITMGERSFLSLEGATLTNLGTITIGQTAKIIVDPYGELSNSGTVTNSGAIETMETWESGAVKAFGKLTGTKITGTITHSAVTLAYADLTAALAKKVEHTEDNYYTALSIPAGAALTLGESLTLDRPLSIDKGGAMTVPDGKALTVSDGQPLNVDGTLTVAMGGTFTIAGGGSVTVSGALANHGTVTKTGELVFQNGKLEGTTIANIGVTDWYDSAQSAPTVLPQGTTALWCDALFPNTEGLKAALSAGQTYGSIRPERDVTLTESITIDGAKNVELSDGAVLTVPSGKNLTVNQGGRLFVGTEGKLVIAGTLFGRGEVRVEKYQEPANEKPGGILENGGNITIQGEGDGVNLTVAAGGTFTNTGTLTNNRDVILEGGTMNSTGTITNQTGAAFIITQGATFTGTITNAGYVAAIDVYDTNGIKKAVTIPEPGFVTSSDGQYERNAEVVSALGLTTALAATPAYNGVCVGADVIWHGEIPSNAQVRVQSHYTEQGEVATTLTIDGATTIAADSGIVIERGGVANKAVVNGAITLAGYIEVYGALEKGTSGSVTGAGKIVATCLLNGSGTLAENQPVIGDFGAGIIDKKAIVTSPADFTAAANDSGCSELRLQFTDKPTEIILADNVSTAKAIVIFPGNSLTVPNGKTLTLSSGSALQNSGTVQVYGTVVISDGATFGNNESGNVNVGDNTNNAKITNRGTVTNNATITVMNQGTLDGDGAYSGSGSITKNEGGTITPGTWGTAQ